MTDHDLRIAVARELLEDPHAFADSIEARDGELAFKVRTRVKRPSMPEVHREAAITLCIMQQMDFANEQIASYLSTFCYGGRPREMHKRIMTGKGGLKNKAKTAVLRMSDTDKQKRKDEIRANLEGSKNI